VLTNCQEAVDGCDWVFNLAADMGGMGFIQSNNSVLMYNNTMISINVLEAGTCCTLSRSCHIRGRPFVCCS
jgi:GDP-D-mannose 3',5'-epimerase